jgi:antitoxin component YwqK of YwqJK toxin-antitoxin module
MLKETYQDGKLEGETIIYTMSGNPLEVKTFKNGLLNGAYKYYKEEGIDTYGDYEDGLKTGPWVEHKYNEGGVDEGSYIKGKRNGPWKVGATNLYGKCEGEFKDDMKHGTWNYWKHNGKKWKKEQWDSGVLLK